MADVCSTGGKKVSKLRILFDGGSQMSYITPRARNILELETLDKKQMFIKAAFGGSKTNKNLELVKFYVKTKVSGLSISVNAFVSQRFVIL